MYLTTLCVEVLLTVREGKHARKSPCEEVAGGKREIRGVRIAALAIGEREREIESVSMV